MAPARDPSGFPPIPAFHLGVRFLLEVVLWAGWGLAGWHLLGAFGAIIGVFFSVAVWGIFGTRGDGSRGAPVVQTPGRIRLLLEVLLFAGAAWGIWMGWNRAASETFLTLAVLHYAITWERQWWLLRGAPMPGVG